MKIVTLTLNPAVDEHYVPVDGSEGELKLVARDRGGKGINVSRALHRAGIDSICLIAAGERDADAFASGEDVAYLNVKVKRISGGIRTNRHIHTPLGDTVESGASSPISDAEIACITEELDGLLSAGDVLALCGSVPNGTDTSVLVRALAGLRARGVKVIIDSRSLTPRDISEIRPMMIKPNLDEAEQYLGYRPSDENMIAAICALADVGCDDVLLTLGADGAYLCSAGRIYRAAAPRVDAVSTTGAGDSTVCAYLIAASRGLCAEDTLRLAVAFGSAACEINGSAPPHPCRVKELFDEIRAEQIK